MCANPSQLNTPIRQSWPRADCSRCHWHWSLATFVLTLSVNSLMSQVDMLSSWRKFHRLTLRRVRSHTLDFLVLESENFETEDSSRLNSSGCCSLNNCNLFQNLGHFGSSIYLTRCLTSILLQLVRVPCTRLLQCSVIAHVRLHSH